MTVDENFDAEFMFEDSLLDVDLDMSMKEEQAVP